MTFEYLRLEERLATVQAALANAMRELALLQEEYARWRVKSVGDQMLTPQSTEEVMEFWKTWAAKNQKPPTDDVREKVRKQMEETVRLAAEETAALRETVAAAPKPAADPLEKMRTVASVLGVNGVQLGVMDPRATPPQFMLMEHRVTADVQELFDETFGKGQYALAGAAAPDAPPADLRHRPDLIQKSAAKTPAFQPIPAAPPVMPRPATAIPPPATAIPPTFDGATGLRSPVAVASFEKIPNGSEK